MELLEGIRARKSIRGYRPDPVPKKVLTELMEVAIRSPSALNIQSWEFFILGGDVLEEVKRAYMEQFSAGAELRSDIPLAAPTGVYRERQIALAKQLFGLLEIAREDIEKRTEWTKKGLRFFDAPAAIIICADKSAPPDWPVFDAGLVAQTIALAAQEFGLGTCIQQAIVGYPDILRRIAGIPESKQIIVGLSIGYPDWDYPANKLRSDREPLENLVTWCGID